MKKLLLILILLFTTSEALAEVRTDGTIGAARTLTGPSYQITSDLGRQIGGNLFHSFAVFDIAKGEGAVFSGPASVRNIITRVTGGNITNIDGTIASTINGADLYLINPSGIIFAQDARLQMSGSFYASTSEYLRLGSDGVFHAAKPKESILVSAQPSAFGFLSNRPKEINITGGYLTVSEGKGMTFIGGDINIQNGTIYAPSGRITIVSASSKGEAAITTAANTSPIYTSDTFTSYGNISITDNRQDSDRRVGNLTLANIDTTGKGGGTITIKSGNLNMDKGYIFSDYNGNISGGSISINNAETIEMKNGSRITTGNFGIGNAGDIRIISRDINITDASTMSTSNFLTGRASDLVIEAGRDIRIDKGSIYSNAYGRGTAGNIKIRGRDITIDNEGIIEADTYLGGGKAGNIGINADNKLKIENNSKIVAQSLGTKNAGNAGDIEVSAGALKIHSGGKISTEAKAALGGNINIITEGVIDIYNGEISATVATGTGSGGDVSIRGGVIALNQGKILARAAEGHGGNILISTQVFITSAMSTVSASSNKGIDGIVNIQSPVVDIAGNIVTLSSHFMDIEGLRPKLCPDRYNEMSSFVIKSRDGLPPMIAP